MKKFIGIVIVATGISFPAFAQSFDPDNGTGNLVNITTAAPARVEAGIVTQQSGEEAYAMSARRKNESRAGSADDAGPGYANKDNTGGGSAGYNELLRNW